MVSNKEPSKLSQLVTVSTYCLVLLGTDMLTWVCVKFPFITSRSGLTHTTPAGVSLWCRHKLSILISP